MRNKLPSPDFNRKGPREAPSVRKTRIRLHHLVLLALLSGCQPMHLQASPTPTPLTTGQRVGIQDHIARLELGTPLKQEVDAWYAEYLQEIREMSRVFFNKDHTKLAPGEAEDFRQDVKALKQRFADRYIARYPSEGAMLKRLDPHDLLAAVFLAYDYFLFDSQITLRNEPYPLFNMAELYPGRLYECDQQACATKAPAIKEYPWVDEVINQTISFVNLYPLVENLSFPSTFDLRMSKPGTNATVIFQNAGRVGGTYDMEHNRLYILTISQFSDGTMDEDGVKEALVHETTHHLVNNVFQPIHGTLTGQKPTERQQQEKRINEAYAMLMQLLVSPRRPAVFLHELYSHEGHPSYGLGSELLQDIFRRVLDAQEKAGVAIPSYLTEFRQKKETFREMMRREDVAALGDPTKTIAELSRFMAGSVAHTPTFAGAEAMVLELRRRLHELKD